MAQAIQASVPVRQMIVMKSPFSTDEKLNSYKDVTTLRAGREIELAYEPFVEREVPGFASHDELDSVGAGGTGVEINQGPPGDYLPQPILQKPGARSIDDQPQLLLAAAVERIEKELGALTVAVNNAGIGGAHAAETFAVS